MITTISAHHPMRGLSASLLVLALAASVLTTACSPSGSDSALDTDRTPVPGTESGIPTTVSVGGRKLYVECTGSGDPTVVLQSGFGNAGDIWSLTDTDSPAVQPALAQTNRVCVYDRPGSMITTTEVGGKIAFADAPQRCRSDEAPMPRDPVAVVTELHSLLETAGVPKPYVMAGHSLGGTFSVLYARTYPSEVAGLVAIDSPQPGVRTLAGAKYWKTMSFLSNDPSVLPGYVLESYDFNQVFDEIEAAAPFPVVPVIVLRRSETRMSDDPPPADAGLPPAEVDKLGEAQRESQAQFAASVPGAELITVPGTTHYIQNQRPDAVVEAVRTVIARS
jgi:pimeloyl-ACP methyl ester carboxylesterase